MFKIGDTVKVDDGNKIYVGKITAMEPYSICLEQASWVANTGRSGDFMLNGNGGSTMEVEPEGEIMLHWRSISKWPHKLFKGAI